MIYYAFDLYPRGDPVNGARVLRFSDLQQAEYRGEANGTGSGRIIIRGTSTDAVSIDPRGMQYVRVVRINTAVVDGTTLSGFSEAVVGGVFLENGDYEALTEHSTKKLVFGGAGALSYLARAQMWSHTYFPGGDDPRDGVWQDTPVDPTHTLGYILWRWMLNAQAFQAGAYNHEHWDGIDYTDTHDDDRLATAIPDMTMTFDGDLDSDGNAWTLPFGALSIGVGESMLAAARLFMESGLYLEMDPDTFELNAYEAAGHGRDRTGVAWGANVVRFQAPSAATVASGNIKSDAKRGIGAFIKRSVVLAGSGNVYGLSTTGGSDIPWEGFYPSTNDDTDALEGVAAVQLGARADAGDTVRLRGKLGNAPTTGEYLPFEHILLDDRVTLHTGSGEWDWDETEQKVAAITLKLRPGSDWDYWIDLGSKYSSIESRAFQNQPVGAHTHPPNPVLCGGSKNILNGLSGSALKVSSSEGINTKERAVDNDEGTHWSAANAEAVLDEYWAADTSAALAISAYRVLQDVLAVDRASEFRIYGATLATAWSSLPSGKLTSYDPTANDWTLLATNTANVEESGLVAIVGGSYRYWLIHAVAGSSPGTGLGWNIWEFELWSNEHAGTLSSAARCDHGHFHNDLDGRDTVGAHPATTVTDSGGSTVQAAIDSLRARGWKQSVRVATAAAGTLASAYENGDTIDGVVLATGNRILLKDQTAGAENGIYTVNASGAPTRAEDMDASAEVLGAVVLVEEGTANADKVFRCTNNATIVLGTTALVFTEISGGAAIDYAEDADISTQAFGDAPAAGASTTEVAGAQHKHGMPANPFVEGTSAKASGSSDLSGTTTTAADVTGATLSLAAGIYIVIGNYQVEINSGDRVFEGILDVAGVDENDLAIWEAVGADDGDDQQVVQVWRITLGSTSTVKLQARHSGGTTGDFDVKAANTTLVAFRVGGHLSAVNRSKAIRANGGTVVNPENAAETAVPDLGTISVTLDETRTVVVRYVGQVVKGTDGHKVKFHAYRDTTKLPGPDNGWYSQSVGEGSRQQVVGQWIDKDLASGTYVYSIKSNAALGTSSSTYQEQSLTVEVIDETA